MARARPRRRHCADRCMAQLRRAPARLRSRPPICCRPTPNRPALSGSFHIRRTPLADYFTQFSCIFDVGSAENAARADDIRGELAAELDRHEGACLGFEMEVD